MYEKVGFGKITPDGWIKRYLEKQIGGITGHIDDCLAPFNDRTTDWYVQGDVPEVPPGSHWAPYEQKAYWIDGALKCAYLTNSAPLLSRVWEQIYGVLNTADEDGYLGPALLKPEHADKKNYFPRWPHVVLFRGMIAEYEITGDKTIIEKMVAHYKGYPFDYSVARNVLNVEILVWLYGKTGDKELLNMAVSAFDGFLNDCTWPGMKKENIHDLSKEEFVHGVTYCEIAKLGAILYSVTKNEEYLSYSIHAFEKLKRHSLLVCGVHSSCEFLDGNGPLSSHEICDIVDLAWALYYMFAVTGNAEYLDIVEKGIFNALPGSALDSFKMIQYFSCANQTIATEKSNHNSFDRGGNGMAFRKTGIALCCIGNVNRALPNYVYNMYMKKGEGYVALLYGDCTLSDEGVTITQKTEYPFDERVTFTFAVAEEEGIPFACRIPSWCKTYKVLLKGKTVEGTLENGIFTLKSKVMDGDEVSLYLEMPVRFSSCGENTCVVERGPVLYSLPIESRAKLSESTLSLELYPISKWNYAIGCTEADVQVIKQDAKDFCFNANTAPVTLILPAVEVTNWANEKVTKVQRKVYKDATEQIDDDFTFVTVEGDFEFTPPLPKKEQMALGKETEITLVPYGTTTLRLTVFPRCK
ncbi:MAG: hypothetical protein E7363_00735 [Clostridiales bacterium]|nr:hypothetical protein [Clostridiales bacterium]